MASSACRPTDWKSCIFCQTKSNEDLINPTSQGYASIETHLLGFQRVGCLPSSLNVENFDDGSGISSTLAKQGAKWHKNCRAKYNQRMLDRAEKRKLEETGSESTVGSDKRVRRECGQSSSRESCVFDCGKTGLHLSKGSTFQLDTHIREAALKVGDTKLLAKLAAGDVIAIDLVYHRECLIELYNKARSVERAQASCDSDRDAQLIGIAFAELVMYLEDELSKDPHVVKLADAVSLYQKCLNELGHSRKCRENSTRLKEKLLAHIPGLTAHNKGRDVLLILDTDVGEALSKAMDKTQTTEALILAQAAKIVRANLFSECYTFDGNFEENCQETAVPVLVLSFVDMILEGPGILNNENRKVNLASLSIA